VCVLRRGGREREGGREGGGLGIAKEAYLKAGVYLRQGNEKDWTTKLVILQIRPVTSSLSPLRAGGG